MTLKPITIDISEYPTDLHPILVGANIYDSSCSEEARVIFIEKAPGYFLKSAPKGKLEQEAAMTKYFHTKGLAANVLAYISREKDWLLTEKILGDDCTTAKYLEEPTRLCDTLAERLIMLHATDYADCPIANHAHRYLASAKRNMETGNYDKSHFPDSHGYKTPEEAWAVIQTYGGLLKDDTLLHGDYCLPNVILDNWRFSGFIDLDQGCIGDRHVDIFWALWSLSYNLKTDRYRQRFIDGYGRNRVNEDILRLVAAVEVFG